MLRCVADYVNCALFHNKEQVIAVLASKLWKCYGLNKYYVIYVCMDSHYYVSIHASCTSIQHCLESNAGWDMGVEHVFISEGSRHLQAGFVRLSRANPNSNMISKSVPIPLDHLLSGFRCPVLAVCDRSPIGWDMSWTCVYKLG